MRYFIAFILLASIASATQVDQVRPLYHGLDLFITDASTTQTTAFVVRGTGGATITTGTVQADGEGRAVLDLYARDARGVPQVLSTPTTVDVLLYDADNLTTPAYENRFTTRDIADKVPERTRKALAVEMNSRGWNAAQKQAFWDALRGGLVREEQWALDRRGAVNLQ